MDIVRPSCAAFLGGILFVGLFPTGALAQSRAADEVLVTARSIEETLPQELARYGNRVQTISAQQLRDGGFNDVGQALQTLAPGLYLAPRSGAFDYVELSLQGSRTGDVLWLLDGVRLNNRLYNGTTPIDTIPAHMIERIEVLEGGQGLMYGTQAVAGVINVVTRAFSEKPDGALTLGADTNDGRHLNGYFRNGFGSHRVVLYGSIDEADGFQPFRDQDFQPSATDRERGYDVRSFGAKYAYDFGDVASLNLMYQHTDAELERPQPKSVARALNERDEHILSVRFDYTPSDSLRFFVKGYYHWWDAFFSQSDSDPTSPTGSVVVSDREFWGFEDYGVNALMKLAVHEGFEYYLGYDLQRYSGQDDVLLIARRSESVHAPFAQIRTTSALFPRLRLAAGIRHNSPDSGASATVWNVSGHWDLTDRLFVRGTLGTAFRLPDAYELFAIDPCCEFGNPNLEPEKSENLNLSIGGTFALGGTDLRWEAIGFFRDVTNLITVVFDPFAGLDTFENVDDTVRVRGGQLVLSAAWSSGLSAQSSFTFTDATRSGSSLQIQEIPETQLKLELDYAPPGWPYGVSLAVNHVGDIYRDLGIGRQGFGNYAVIDLGARLYLGPQRRHRIGARLENLFDEEYATRVAQTTPDGGGAPYAYWFLGTPRTLHVTYTYAF